MSDKILTTELLTEGLSNDQVNEILKMSYGLEWLNSNDNHPIQRLWQRKDGPAKIELLALATGIHTLNTINSKWVSQQVAITKSMDVKNMQGAIFEILCLALLHDQNNRVTPANFNLAGYDGVLSFEHDKKIRVSIKSYGKSTAQKEFEKASERVKDTIEKLVEKYNYPPVNVVISSPHKCPSLQNWNDLINHLDPFLKEGKNEPASVFGIFFDKKRGDEAAFDSLPMWICSITHIRDISKYDARQKSYHLIIHVPLHHNEYKNLYDKIEEACFNLSKHSAYESNSLANMLFVRLPRNVSIESCRQWLVEYFKLYPEKPISIVILLQVGLAHDNSTGNWFVHSCIQYLSRDEKLSWHPRMRFTCPYSLFYSKPRASKLIQIESTDAKEILVFENCYLYQYGTFYVTPKQVQGSTVGHIKDVTKGVSQNVIIDGEQPGTYYVYGPNEKLEELTIL